MSAHKIKAHLAGLLCLLCLLLAGCAARFDAAALVQGNIDVVYRGVYDAAYLGQVGMTEEEAAAIYEDALQTEAAYFAGYFDIDTALAGDDVMPQLVELYRTVYAQTKYELGTVTEDGEDYLVELTVYPIDVFRRFIDEDSENFMQTWREKLASAEFADKTEQEIEAAWAADLIAAVSARVDTLGYLEPQTIQVRVTQDAAGSYTIADADWDKIDELILSY